MCIMYINVYIEHVHGTKTVKSEGAEAPSVARMGTWTACRPHLSIWGSSRIECYTLPRRFHCGATVPDAPLPV